MQVIKPNDDIISLFQREPLCSVSKAKQVQDILGQDVVNLSVTSVEPLDLQIGQRVTVFGKTYYLNQIPTAQKKGERHFEYELTFEGPQYSLCRPAYFNADVTGFIRLRIFRSQAIASFSWTCYSITWPGCSAPGLWPV